MYGHLNTVFILTLPAHKSIVPTIQIKFHVKLGRWVDKASVMTVVTATAFERFIKDVKRVMVE